MAVNGGSPAERAGLRGGSKDVDVLGRTVSTGGDVIVAIDGSRTCRRRLRFVSFSLKPKDVAVFTIARGGKRHKVAVTLTERDVPSG